VVRFLEVWRERVERASPGRRRALRWGAIAASVGATAATFVAADAQTVDSIYAPLERLDIFSGQDRARLVGSGLETPEALLRALSTEAEIGEWSDRTGIPPSQLRDIRERVALVMHRGLGQDRVRELEGLGIRTRGDLAVWSPERLAEALRALGARGPDRFLERRARVWLEGTRKE
jgi:hypothetical protein